MEIRYSMFRRGKQGSDDAGAYRNNWTLRFSFSDEQGTVRRKTYQFATRTDAVDARPKLEAEHKNTQGQSVIGDEMTFRDLAGDENRFRKATMDVQL